MLGLGNSLVTGGPTKELLFTYNSDFTVDVDGWYVSSIDEGDLNLTANESIDGIDDWLKGTFTETQTSYFILLRKSIGSGTMQSGYTYTMTYKMHIVDNSNKWGSSPPITHKLKLGGVSNSVPVAYDTTTSIDLGESTAINTSYVLDFDFAVAGDFPQADAVFYIKDVALNVYSM